MTNSFNFISKTALVLVYLVIVAGALVRMTGSGMGCPDWPKCFGYYIPPSDIKELTWAPKRQFESGQVIIKNQRLLVATDDFVTGVAFDVRHWRPYTKHDYAIFNPTHTWIEYLNRLMGALAGIAVFVMAAVSIKYWQLNRRIPILSWLAVFLMGFQGWLGATVVYSVLNPVKITIHMIVALIIVAVILSIIKMSNVTYSKIGGNPAFNKIILFALSLTLIQIVLGTQVRQFVDEQVKALGSGQMHFVFRNPDFIFYFHRSFSILVFFVNLFLFILNRNSNLGLDKINWAVFLLCIEIISGLAMYYFGFPFGFQALHLVIASILFGTQFYLYLESITQKTVS